MSIPIIDLFAGPGGLGEGFSSINNEKNERIFKIVLSIENNPYAHQTLTLRSFYRQFGTNQVPLDYYDFIRGNITLDTLYSRWPTEAQAARDEALIATLGDYKDAIPKEVLDEKIRHVLNGHQNWVLIGGPPCQAYSVVGRSRRKQLTLDGRTDKRVKLYKHYLRIIAVHNPAVFVMENVKGLLSAKSKNHYYFDKIINDLNDPVRTYNEEFPNNGLRLNNNGYKIYSLVLHERGRDENENPIFNQTDFIIKAEKYGIPQTRHRLILLGIRNDINAIPNLLEKSKKVPISSVITGLPPLRSGLSKIKDSKDNWSNVFINFNLNGILDQIDTEIREKILNQIQNLTIPAHSRGMEFIPDPNISCEYMPDWYLDHNLKGISNHISRSHMEKDLLRYMFVSCFAKIKNFSPKLQDFPNELLPNHKNVQEGIKLKKFADRFRVQLENEPAKTITSHISKDGHYYIHPDPSQCRSLTVREAARIQTFPDNYFFCGPRTEQFHQVGNAVPPLLAWNIANIVNQIFLEY